MYTVATQNSDTQNSDISQNSDTYFDWAQYLFI